MTDEPVPMPGGLTAEERSAWADAMTSGVVFTRADTPALVLACGWLVAARRLLQAAEAAPTNLGLIAVAVSATSTAMKTAAALGLTPLARRKLGLEMKRDKPKAVPKRRTSLDDLTPEKLGLRPAANTNAEG